MRPRVLETERLVLEPLGASHSEGMFELWSSPEVCRYSGEAADWSGNPLRLPAATAEVSDAIIDFFERHAAAGNGFRWAAIEAGSGAFIGAIGYNALGSEAELAYHQVPRFWGYGFMREACETALQWAEGEGTRMVVAFVEAENVRSVSLVAQLGFRRTEVEREGAVRYELALGAD